ncbi:hypothetical protein CC80DRAFT_68140 [Byssothecium circinans]|uniref:Transcriptional regulatory protein RXT2 N-terminal domain-containing protein n=1 Tax=Byssothecium circinans TaxID=147558 RepID=A0A6A5TUS8_9PLEO|nr:hypothetical protein CC80DRAFT_68140 [Byssothecium circinans]
MAGQQQQIMETIFSMKRRLLRNDDSSDSEENEKPYSNQKQSLKRKVQYTRSGEPEHVSNGRPFKKRIEHAGYHRYILQRNPPRFDPDGDIVEAGDEWEDDDDLTTVEENPYADIQLEGALTWCERTLGLPLIIFLVLLAPLTSPADLPNHPSYSVAYTSKHLTNLAKEAAVVSRKENITLWHAKSLFNKLQGDSDFAPLALAAMAREPLQDFWGNGTNGRDVNGDTAHMQNGAQTQDTSNRKDVDMEEAGQTNGAHPGNGHPIDVQNGTDPVTNGTSNDADTDKPQANGDASHSPAGDDASETASQMTAHRMTTRARANAASTPSPPVSPSDAINPIHPLFTFATSSLPDRDFGLPEAEAEETRMLLMAYVQKQEEIARMARDLSHGMMQAERMRQDVFKWSKAEAHVGEMSDGEDWYDQEEWGLDGELGKGKDEEEEEGAVATGKKSTRQRRRADKDDR